MPTLLGARWSDYPCDPDQQDRGRESVRHQVIQHTISLTEYESVVLSHMNRVSQRLLCGRETILPPWLDGGGSRSSPHC